ncbi:unnamed protein product [Mytilus coruscus]|uniref:Uncharacterized protein n=1 Tax=Mytilus coruscus TaxID=42192 RepID=A0A6J8A1Y9_MYTCO|nr:unnamed protein product [Mytilus coruscus]
MEVFFRTWRKVVRFLWHFFVISLIQAALHGCPYCKEEGLYCESLHKVVPLNNGAFLPKHHPLREEKNDFPIKAENDELPPAPWRLDRSSVKIAHQRAMSLVYPTGYDYHPDQHFSKPWTLRTMHGKHQIYDWCVYMIMPGKVKQDDVDNGKLERLLLEDEKDESCSTNGKKFFIDDNILKEMANIYDFCLISRMEKESKELVSCTRSYGNTTDGNTGRKINFSSYSNNKSSNSYVYAVDQHSTDSFVDSMIFGSICKIFEHVWRGQTYTWVLLDTFDDIRYEDGFWSVLERKTSQIAVMLKDVSAPQIVGRENDRLYYVSTSIYLVNDQFSFLTM